MTEDSALIKRIRALLAKANDAGVTEFEAEMFAAKAQELLARHGLDESSLKEESSSTIGAHREEFKQMSGWRQLLLRSICRFYMCEAINYRSHWKVVGTKANASVAKEMYGYLLKTIHRLASEYLDEHGPAPGFAPGRTTEDFKRGCAARVGQRLDEMRKAQMSQKSEWKSPGNPGNLPALMQSQSDAVRSFCKTQLAITWGKTKSLRIGSPGAAGLRAGDSVGLNTQVGGARTTGRLAIGSK